MNTQLVRSSSDKMLGGVCGGLARYFGIDSSIVRLLFVLTVIFAGVSPLVYVVLWIILPLDVPTSSTTTPPALTGQDPTDEWQYDPYTGQRIQK